jgi:hypothetical protein
VLLTRADPAQATNWLSIEYLDAANSYNPQLIAVFDQGAIDTYGLRTQPSMQAHSITNPSSATISAQFTAAAAALCAQHLQVQARLALCAARTDGHRADQ